MKRTELKRKPMKRTQPKRDWTAARAKCDAEEVCRVGGVCGGKLEAAHLIGRERDQYGLDGWPRSVWRVEPVRIVPLCTTHHLAYDRHELDLLGHLTADEEAQAVLDADGLELARRRLYPTAYRSAAASPQATPDEARQGGVRNENVVAQASKRQEGTERWLT